MTIKENFGTVEYEGITLYLQEAAWPSEHPNADKVVHEQHLAWARMSFKA